ncbi:MAG: YjgN family protein [Hyphomicrobiaceae bacterium]
MQNDGSSPRSFGAPPAMTDHGAVPAGRGERVELKWVGSPWELTGLSFINFMLSVVTLGIYSFWGKTEVRKRLWSSVRLQGEPFTYTGTGKELFLGFLFAVAVFFIPILALSIAAVVVFGPDSPIVDLLSLPIYVIIFLFMGIAMYRARRYRLSRTLWRGIRGGMSGSPKSFAGLWIWTTLLLGVTAGWFAPQRAVMIQKRLHDETTFGSESFRFTGDSGPLYPPFAVLWIGAFLLYIAVIGSVLAAIGLGNLGKIGQGQDLDPSELNFQPLLIFAIVILALLTWFVLSAWYQARKLIHFARCTTIDNARFAMHITGMGLIGLVITNMLISFVSLGILSPVAQARGLKYFVDRMHIDGTFDFARITQSQAALGQGGEGLAQAFDVDAF